MLGECFPQPFGFLRAAFFAKPLADPVHRLSKAVLIDRLHEIIDRLRIERPQGVLIIGGHEHEQRRLDVHQPLDDRETIEARHLHVEEDEVRLVGLDLADRFTAVGGGRDNFDIIEGLQPQLEALGGERFVVDQNGPDGHAALSPVSYGISTITLKPPRSFCLVSKRCPPP